MNLIAPHHLIIGYWSITEFHLRITECHLISYMAGTVSRMNKQRFCPQQCLGHGAVLFCPPTKKTMFKDTILIIKIIIKKRPIQRLKIFVSINLLLLSQEVVNFIHIYEPIHNSSYLDKSLS